MCAKSEPLMENILLFSTGDIGFSFVLLRTGDTNQVGFSTGDIGWVFHWCIMKVIMENIPSGDSRLGFPLVI